MTFQEFFLDPVASSFGQNAVLVAIMVGIISGVIGSFVVVRGMSFFGDALAHSVLPGVAVAFIYGGGAATLPLISDALGLFEDEGVRLFIGGLVAGVLAALVIGFITRDRRLREDTAIGIIFVAMFALGIIIISTDPRAYGQNLLHILFGNLLQTTRTDLWIVLISGVVVIGIVIAFYKELLVISFDAELGRALKLPAERLRLLLLVLIAVTIVASLQTVGIVMMLAMLITPAATAQLLTRRLHHMMVLSALIGAVGAVAGWYATWHLRLPVGPAIVLVLTAVFGLVFVMTSIVRQFAGRRRGEQTSFIHS
ncbi:MAG: metal ABC transporter permease [Phototrophicaceae bacterium]